MMVSLCFVPTNACLFLYVVTTCGRSAILCGARVSCNQRLDLRLRYLGQMFCRGDIIKGGSMCVYLQTHMGDFNNIMPRGPLCGCPCWPAWVFVDDEQAAEALTRTGHHPFHCGFVKLNSMDIFCYHPYCSEMIATKFCTYHDSCAVVVCAKCRSDAMTSRRITVKRIFHRISIGSKKLVKWAPGRKGNTCLVLVW